MGYFLPHVCTDRAWHDQTEVVCLSPESEENQPPPLHMAPTLESCTSPGILANTTSIHANSSLPTPCIFEVVAVVAPNHTQKCQEWQ